MMPFFTPRGLWLRAKTLILFLLLLVALAAHDCTHHQAQAAPISFRPSLPLAVGELLAPSPVSVGFRSYRMARLVPSDSLRAVGLGHLGRKAAPRSRWHGFGAPAYLPALARRPSQYVLDSLAAAARRR